MKFDSPLFDRIRVKRGQDRRPRDDHHGCDWPGCAERADHRAPKGRLREGEYWRFCLAHVREYNHSYNYFTGMSEDAVTKFQKDALNGHRPTWKNGMNGKTGPRGKSRRGSTADYGEEIDPLGIFAEHGEARQRSAERSGRLIGNAERKALNVLGFEGDASLAEIKTRFKVLVKRHHPDANGGDRGSEDTLRDIIQAYNYLKTTRR
jgi:curved DNA-binding protein CbpA